MSRIAAVDDPDGKGLRCVALFDFPRDFEWGDGSGQRGIPSQGDPRAWDFLRLVKLTRWPSRFVEVTNRPDIEVGEPFPFIAKHLKDERDSAQKGT